MFVWRSGGLIGFLNKLENIDFAVEQDLGCIYRRRSLLSRVFMAFSSIDLLHDVHRDIEPPSYPLKSVCGKYAYYHYLCDGFDDCGWGCGYRTLQTMCSWIYYNFQDRSNVKMCEVPSIVEIQNALVAMQDKPFDFVNSKKWIGSFEVCLCLDYFYDVPCKIHHVRTSENLSQSIAFLQTHFEKFASPVMMGGDSDAASKCILGICGSNESDCYLLILDPHCSKKPTMKSLVNDNWISWRKIDSFVQSSFYNMCLPQRSVVKTSN